MSNVAAESAPRSALARLASGVDNCVQFLGRFPISITTEVRSAVESSRFGVTLPRRNRTSICCGAWRTVGAAKFWSRELIIPFCMIG